MLVPLVCILTDIFKWEISSAGTSGALTRRRSAVRSRHLLPFRCSSAAEQKTVNQNVVGSNPTWPASCRSQSVHGRTRACHARRRGSLPLGTAKLMHCSSIGKDAALSRRKDEFDSRTVYQQCIPGVNGSMTVSKTAGGGSNPSGYANMCRWQRGPMQESAKL